MFVELLPSTKAVKPVNRYVMFTATPNLVTGTGETVLGFMELTIGRKGTTYILTEIPNVTEGRGYRLTKPEHEKGTDEEARNHDVFVCARGERSNCECKGWLRHGQCKHLDAIVALEKNGQLNQRPALVNDEADTACDAAESDVYAARDDDFGF